MTTPTEEQEEILLASDSNQDIVVKAFAGTGKTTTLRMIGERKELADQKGLFLAYNASVRAAAKTNFPSNTAVHTGHSYAMSKIGFKYSHRLKSNERMPGRELANRLHISNGLILENGIELSAVNIAYVVKNTIRRFCNGSDEYLMDSHVPYQTGLSDEDMGRLKDIVLPKAVMAWQDIQSPKGTLPFEHDHYLKLWAMDMTEKQTQIPVDFILYDEAQDANPVIADVIGFQNAQVIYVGDSNQAIYAWRGAIDAMDKFEGKKLYLSQSFRFGDAIAEEANKWLRLLEEEKELKGLSSLSGSVEYLESPDTVLCRTNAEAVRQVIGYLKKEMKVAMVGGGSDIQSFCFNAVKLMQGKQVEFGPLVAFKDWEEVLEYVKDDSGGDLKVLVNLVRDFGAVQVIDAMKSLVSVDHADVVVSTAHKAKGMEWEKVKIANDFRQSEEGDMPGSADMMLNYVCVTRAKSILDRGSLSFVDSLVKNASM